MTEFESMKNLVVELGNYIGVVEYGSLYTILVEKSFVPNTVTIWTYSQFNGKYVKGKQKNRKVYQDKHGTYFQFLGSKLYI